MAAIHERATTFVSKCVKAGQKSVDVYVSQSLSKVCRHTYVLTRSINQSLLHCYALDCVTHFMFSPGGLKSLDSPQDYEIMHELTYHQSLQSEYLISTIIHAPITHP